MSTLYHGKEETMSHRLIQLFTRADAEDIAQGERWYPDAQRIVSEWSEHFGHRESTVACIIAAISPQCEWTRNLIIAHDVLLRRPQSVGGAVHRFVDIARRIERDEASSLTMYFKGGPKVKSFAENLMGNMDVVTVDTHATQAALGDASRTIPLTPARYQPFSAAYVIAAHACNRTPAEFQAIVWHTWKRLYTPETKRRLIAERKEHAR
jgi:hypothetical protein